MCLDRKRAWLIVGTSTGVLSLWDRRFGLLIKSWKCAAAQGKAARVHQCVVHPAKGRGKWIMVALENPNPDPSSTLTVLVEVWDVETGMLVETFASKTSLDGVEEPKEVPAVEAESNSAAAIAQLVRSRHPAEKRSPTQGHSFAQTILPRPSANVRAMVVGLDFGGLFSHRMDASTMSLDPTSTTSRSGGRGFMITGCEDRAIRMWDLGQIERTTILSGGEPEQDRSTFRSVCCLYYDI
jgi:phosphoinositide-3-kinase, regulatory subunit 4